MEKEELDELKVSPFELAPIELEEDDPLQIAGHPVKDGVQQPLNQSYHWCEKILGTQK